MIKVFNDLVAEIEGKDMILDELDTKVCQITGSTDSIFEWDVYEDEIIYKDRNIGDFQYHVDLDKEHNLYIDIIVSFCVLKYDNNPEKILVHVDSIQEC